MQRLVLGLMVLVLSLGWAWPSEAGSRGRGGRGHGGSHHGSHYGGHRGGHHGGHYGGHHGRHYGGHYYRRGHHDYYWGSLLFYGAPYLLSLFPPYPARGPVAAPAATTGYVEQSSYWYYCPDPEGYHPYVRDCPGGWMQVVPSGPPR